MTSTPVLCIIGLATLVVNISIFLVLCIVIYTYRTQLASAMTLVQQMSGGFARHQPAKPRVHFAQDDDEESEESEDDDEGLPPSPTLKKDQ